MDSKIIEQKNYNEFNNSGIEGQPLKIGFFNRFFRDLRPVYDLIIAMIPSLGTLKGDTLSELTSDAGVTIDSLTIKDGKVGATTAITANATGVLAAIIPAYQQHVVITCSNVNHIVSLPLLADVPTGTQISGSPVNTGCELRVHPNDISASKYINNVTGGNELKVNNGTGCAYFEAVKKSSARWIVKTWSSAGASTTITPDK